MVVSGVTVGLLVGVVPGWPHRHDLIRGEWVSLDGRPGTWEFTTTGTMRSPIIRSSTFGGETETRLEGYQQAKYYFIDDEHIEARTYLWGVMMSGRMKVSVTEDELIMTFDDPIRTVKYKRVK
jgi:hypothetical protein